MATFESALERSNALLQRPATTLQLRTERMVADRAVIEQLGAELAALRLGIAGGAAVEAAAKRPTETAEELARRAEARRAAAAEARRVAEAAAEARRAAAAEARRVAEAAAEAAAEARRAAAVKREARRAAAAAAVEAAKKAKDDAAAAAAAAAAASKSVSSSSGSDAVIAFKYVDAYVYLTLGDVRAVQREKSAPVDITNVELANLVAGKVYEHEVSEKTLDWLFENAADALKRASATQLATEHFAATQKRETALRKLSVFEALKNSDAISDEYTAGAAREAYRLYDVGMRQVEGTDGRGSCFYDVFSRMYNIMRPGSNVTIDEVRKRAAEYVEKNPVEMARAFEILKASGENPASWFAKVRTPNTWADALVVRAVQLHYKVKLILITTNANEKGFVTIGLDKTTRGIDDFTRMVLVHIFEVHYIMPLPNDPLVPVTLGEAYSAVPGDTRLELADAIVELQTALRMLGPKKLGRLIPDSSFTWMPLLQVTHGADSVKITRDEALTVITVAENSNISKDALNRLEEYHVFGNDIPPLLIENRGEFTRINGRLAELRKTRNVPLIVSHGDRSVTITRDEALYMFDTSRKSGRKPSPTLLRLFEFYRGGDAYHPLVIDKDADFESFTNAIAQYRYALNKRDARQRL